MRREEIHIKEVTPALAIPGGEVTIHCSGYQPGLPSESAVLVGDVGAAVISASPESISIRLPSNPHSLGLSLRVGDTTSPVYPLVIAVPLATGLHPVTSPAAAPDGSIITTISGARGEQTPQPLVRITRNGDKVPFAAEIMNPTGLAFGPDGQLYVSSRNDGTVSRYTDFEELEVIADDLGVACGLAFDSEGLLYVGDRSGRVWRMDTSGERREEWAKLEPSISAYHLAMDAADRLYVTGPTIAMRDPLYRIPAKGQVDVVVRGLARPQGMAFTPEGELLIASAYAGRKGIFRLVPDRGQLEHYIAGPMLVGIAVSGGDLFPADNATVYRLRPGGSAAQ